MGSHGIRSIRKCESNTIEQHIQSLCENSGHPLPKQGPLLESPVRVGPKCVLREARGLCSKPQNQIDGHDLECQELHSQQCMGSKYAKTIYGVSFQNMGRPGEWPQSGTVDNANEKEETTVSQSQPTLDSCGVENSTFF